MDNKVVFEARNRSKVFFTVNQRPNGYFTVERPSPHTVAGLVYNTDTEEYIFVKQYREPINDYSVELVAGLDDKGTSMFETMRQEVIEEIGYLPISIVKLGEVTKSAGILNEIEHIFYVSTDNSQKIKDAGCGLISEGELIETVTIHYTKLREFLRNSTVHKSSGIYTALHLKALTV